MTRPDGALQDAAALLEAIERGDPDTVLAALRDATEAGHWMRRDATCQPGP